MNVNVLGRLALVLGVLPRWSAVALREPQAAIEARLNSGGGATIDVTGNNEIAGLVPLTLAIGLDLPDTWTAPFVLSFSDRKQGWPLGSLRLRRIAREADTPIGVTFFEVEGGRHACLGWVGDTFDDWYRRHGEAPNPRNFAMAPEATKWAAIFYLCPRPVFLVSVKHESRSNIFPMDQVGRMRSDGEVSLSLRSTNPSVDVIAQSRRVVLSSVAGSRKTDAYQLGTHHKKESIDPGELPFELATSATFGFRIPANAVRVRELEITQFKTMGSHVFFIGTAVTDKRMSDEPQLFHTPGFHQRFRTRRGSPFAPA